MQLLLYLCGVVLLLFVCANYFGIEDYLGFHIQPWMQSVGVGTAALGSILLLWLDIILPIPSSIVMIANGYVFGMWLGCLLSLIGGVGSSYIAFHLGSLLSPWVDRKLEQEQQEYYQQLIQKWGVWSFVITRPIPVMSESVALMSHALNLKQWQVISYSIISYLPFTLLYAYWGA